MLGFIFTTFDVMGEREMLSLFLGKYHRPIKEKRIFMFIDLKKSTSILGVMGSKDYERFMRDCFSDITRFVIKHGATIYQYVGDEIIISWPTASCENSQRMANFYSDFKKHIEYRETYYQQRYSIIPSFWMSAHLGEVLSCQTGDIKRQISHYGEVLNISARIQGVCRELKEDFIISDKLFNHIKNKNEFIFYNLGDFKLRGVGEAINLLSVNMIRSGL